MHAREATYPCALRVHACARALACAYAVVYASTNTFACAHMHAREEVDVQAHVELLVHAHESTYPCALHHHACACAGACAYNDVYAIAYATLMCMRM